MIRMEGKLILGEQRNSTSSSKTTSTGNIHAPYQKGKEYKGPLNYITVAEAYKMELICMNSSMRQPLHLGVRLNDCPLKGPPALADLYMVTLRTQEHRVAFTKDIL
jgi:hypothetical protein